jgi:hypothetical protein
LFFAASLHQSKKGEPMVQLIVPYEKDTSKLAAAKMLAIGLQEK